MGLGVAAAVLLLQVSPNLCCSLREHGLLALASYCPSYISQKPLAHMCCPGISSQLLYPHDILGGLWAWRGMLWLLEH